MALILWLITPRIFLARNIVCITQFGDCSPSIIAKLSGLENIPLLRPLPLTKLQLRLKSLPEVRSVVLTRQLPNSLKVTITLRTPIGQIATDSGGGQNTLFASDGQSLGIAPSSPDLPVLIYNSASVPSRLDPNSLLALQILNQVMVLSKSPVLGWITNNDLYIETQNGPQIVINTNKSASLWYSPLQLILERSKISLKSPKIIDLRFTNPVLTY